MLEQKARKYYQSVLVEPILTIIPQSISPLHITLLSAVIGLAFIPALLFNQSLIAIIILLLSGYLDTVDGSLARARKQCSNFGSVMDIMADRIVECAVILAFFLRAPAVDGPWVIAMLISSLLCITSFLVVGIFEQNESHKSFHYSPGLIERAEAFIFFILMTLFPNSFVFFAALYSVLVFYTAYTRIKEFYQSSI